MGFLDNMEYARGALQSGFVGSVPRSSQPRLNAPQWGVSRPSLSLWGSMSSGRLPTAAPRSRAGVRGADATRMATAATPERIDLRLPPSGEPPAAPTPLSTTGDFLGSVGAAIGNVGSKLNLGNAIPYFMERTHEYASGLADVTANVPFVGPAAQGVEFATGVFLDGVQEASQAIAPALETLPNWYRDSQLGDKAKVYRAIVTGQPISSEFSPIEQFGMSGNLLPFTAAGANQIARDYALYSYLIEQSLNPNDADKWRTKINVLRDSVDLPESVKFAIEANPNADLEQLLDEAPEGRQFSYEPGVPGFIANMGLPLIFYLADYKAALGAGRAAQIGLVGTRAKGVVGTSGLAASLGRAGMAPVSRAVQTGTAAAVRATTVAARLQKYALGAGITVSALTTTMDAVARYKGDQAAIDWYDKVSRTTEFSDDPAVQLVTGFTVNPFEAVGLLKRGTIRLASGVGDVTIGRALGVRFTRYYTHSTLMYDQIKRMYKLGSVAEAEEWVAKNYESKGAAFDEVVGMAVDKVLDTLPKEERLTFNARHPDPTKRTEAALSQYASQVMDLLERHPDEVAARFNQHAWEYHQYPGEFSPEVAALNARDMRGAKKRTYEMRARLDAVSAYTELLPPRGAALARAWLDQVADANGNVKVVGVGGVQDLVRQFPSLRTHWQGLVSGSAKTVPRSTVEEIIARAEAVYSMTSRRSPVKATTGADPVIRPDSPTLNRDYAESLGTTPATIKALEDFKFDKPDAKHVELLRTFIADKLQMDPAAAAAMDPTQVWTAASDYFDDTTRPWADAGQRIVAAEKRQAEVRHELARLARIGVKREAHTEAIRELEAEMSNLLRLTQEAGDPIVPFSREVQYRGVTEKRINKIRSMDPAKLSKADDQLLRTFLLEDLQVDATNLRGADLHQRALDLIPTVTEGRVATARDAHLAEMAQSKVQAMEVLRTLDAIDGQAEAMMPRKVADIPWHKLLRRTPEGNLGWAGGTMPVSEAMRRRIAAYLQGQGGPGRAMAQDMLFKGDSDVWDILSRHPAAMERFTQAQRRYVLSARGLAPDKTGIDEWADAWQKQNDSTSEAFLEELTSLHEARAEALAGRMESNLRRTGEMKVPPVYLTEAEIAQSGRDLWVDAEFETTIHPMNVAKVRDILDNPSELYGQLRAEVYGDNRLLGEAMRIAETSGISVEELLRDPVHASKLKPLIPEDFEPPIPGLAVPETELDALIVARDPAVARLAQQEETLKPAVPVTMLASRAKDIAEKAVRPSVKYRRDLVGAGADMKAAPDGAVLDDPANALGLEVLSVLNRGVTGTRPATTGGVIELLREIENGNATRRGIGMSLQAEGQRVAMEILKAARTAAKREGIEAGVYTKGMDPALMAQDDLDLARTLENTIDPNTGLPKKGGIPAVTYDPSDPLGTLQYGLKKRPKDAVVMEWAQVPGLTEEFLSGHFQPWQERVWTAQARQAFNWVFGRRPNESIANEVRGRFVERLGKQGADPEIAEAIWQRWKDVTRRSRPTDTEKVASPTGGRAMIVHRPGENPRYGDIRNIPTKELDRQAKEAIDEVMATRGESVSPYRNDLMANDYGALFRESSSYLRRAFMDDPIQPLGKALAGLYGKVAHNQWVTTNYYIFRFALDVRYHAMNFFEPWNLGMGRAGLRGAEIETGRLGATREWFQKLNDNPADNVGFPFSRRRAEVAYKTFLKEQPEMLRKRMRGIEAEDPRLMEDALVELAESDPELSKTILLMGDSVDQYLGKMDEQWTKIMRGVDEIDDGKTIDDMFAKEAAKDPALAEVYSRLAQANKDLVGDIRNTFYGNAERSRAERLLNSYLLYWPISYQIKSAKWLFRVLYDRAGGLQTNAAGAVILDRALSSHQQLLATDAEYADWYEKHDTLLFIASQLVPITPTSMGVSLSPPLRALFGRERSALEVGPIYTLQLVKQAAPEAYADLYSAFGDVPGMEEVFRAVTGRTQTAPVDKLGAGDRP